MYVFITKVSEAVCILLSRDLIPSYISIPIGRDEIMRVRIIVIIFRH